MGRLILRAAWGHSDIEFVQINDPAGDGGQHDRHTFDIKAGAALADRPSPV
jgi:glyceraldehyde-3-phosphate dehydrogenase/erythrose-4-phosphate dehydrogenase